MPDLVDTFAPLMVANSAIAEANRRQMEQLEKWRESIGVTKFWGSSRVMSAATEATIGPSISNWISRQGWEPDPKWKLDQKGYDLLREGVDEDLWPRFTEAVSFEHATFLREQAMRTTENRRLLASFGWKGAMLGTAAQLLDPAALGVAAVTGGLASAVRVGTAASRMAQLGKAGFVGASGMAAITATLGLDDPRIGAGDIALAGAAGAGFGVGASLARNANVLGRFALTGAGQAAPGVAGNLAGLATGDRTWSDLGVAAAHDLLMGGVFGAMHKATGIDRAAARLLKDSLWRDAVDTGIKPEDLSPSGRAFFAEQIGEAAEARRAEAIAPIAEELAASVRKGTDNQAIGAASIEDPAFQAPVPPVEGKLEGDLTLRGTNDARWFKASILNKRGREVNIEGQQGTTRDQQRFFGLPKFQFSLRFGNAGAWVGESVIPRMRRISNSLFIDRLQKSDGSLAEFTASEWAEMIRKRYDSRISVSLLDAHGEHVEKAVSEGKKPLSFDEFSAEAARAHIDPNHPSRSDPGIGRAVDSATKLYADMLGMMKRHGVFGAEGVTEDSGYVPRWWHRAALDDAIDRHGRESVINTLARAILREGGENIDPLSARYLAGAIVRRGGLRGFNKNAHWTPEERGSVQDALHFYLTTDLGMSPADSAAAIENVMASFAGMTKPENGGMIPRLRSRIPMDMLHEEVMADGSTLRVSDLLVHDMEQQVRAYARQAIGASANAEIFRVFARPGEKINTINDLLTSLDREARNYSLKPEEYTDDIKTIETALKLIAGIPLQDNNTATARTLKIIREMNMVRSLSSIGVGVQNLSESGGSIAQYGFVRSLDVFFPAFKSVIAKASRGDSKIMRELQEIGTAEDPFATRIRVNDGSEPQTGALAKASRMSHAASQVAMRVSGLKYGQGFMERGSTLLLMQHLSDVAASGKLPRKSLMTSLGWSEAKATKVMEALRKHQKSEDGPIGVKRWDPDVDSWGDIDAQAAYRQGIFRAVRRDILSPNLVEGPRWMTTPVGQLFAQLRRFTVQAWENKLLFAIQQRDVMVFKSVIGSMLAGGLGFAARTILEAPAKQDPEKYLKERLAPNMIAKAAFARSGYSSLIPGAIDSLMNISGRRSVFEFSRGSGLSGNFLQGIPTWDWLTSVARSRQAILGPMTNPEYSFSREDLRAIENGLWLPNVFGLRDVIDRLFDHLPAQSLQNARP